jgi:hypothetical protein
MEKGRKKGLIREEFRKWLLNLVTSLKTIPKRSDNPHEPKHPSESLHRVAEP